MSNSNTATPTHTPPADDESVVQHLLRSAKNAVTKCFGCVQTSDEKAKIKYKEYQIETRKKAFGVAYINLLNSQATEAELKNCVDAALADIRKIHQEIEELQKEIDRVEHATREKILPKPAPGAASAAAAAVPAAATTATAPPAADTPAVITATTLTPTEASPAAAPAATTTNTSTTVTAPEAPMPAKNDDGLEEVDMSSEVPK